MAEEKEEMNYLKYHSNGDLDKINNHTCICCKKLRNDMDIFVFTDNSIATYSEIQPSVVGKPQGNFTYGGTTIFSGQNKVFRPAKENTIFLCAKCLLKLSRKISEEDIANMVVDAI